jgi:hypothetical protein
VLPVLVLQGLFVRIAPLSSSEAPLAPKLDRARVATCTCAGIARLKPDFTVYRRDARAAAAALVPTRSGPIRGSFHHYTSHIFRRLTPSALTASHPFFD